MGLPEAGPGFGDEDAIAGVAGVVADLDGLVDAVAADAVREAGDVLGAVVGDAGEAVAVEEDFGGGGNAVFAVEGAGIDEVAVRDAADGCEAFAAAAFDFFRGGAARADDEPASGSEDEGTCGDAAYEAGIMVLEQLREMVEGAFHGVRQG